jgi:Caspase domain
MKLKALFLWLFILFITTQVSAQSVYLFTYNFHTEKDSTTYSCLFFRNPDGTGLVKLKYNQPVTGTEVINELFAEDNVYPEAEGMQDQHILLVKTSFVSVKGNDTTNLVAAPVFIFREDPASGFFEPIGVTDNTNSTLIAKETFFNSKLLTEKELTREFAAVYFAKSDPYFISYFSKSRGSLLNAKEREMKLFMVIVADTLDKKIGKSAAADLKNMKETVGELCDKIGIRKENFRLQVLAGKQCEKKNVIAAVNKITPGVNDIVIFYYSGHGFRVNSVDTFPHIKATSINTDSVNIVKNSLRIKEDIFDKIKLKKARLTLVISDCCNDDIGRPKDQGPKPPKTRGGDWVLNEKNTRDLFLNEKPVSILVTAAKNGERALCDFAYNSYFSFSFLASLKQFTGKGENNVSWDKLLVASGKGANALANKVCCSKPCCGPSCTTGKPVRCNQTSVLSASYRR